MADWTIKQHDNWPPLVATLSDENGPINLTTAVSVKFIAKTAGTTISGTCAITTPASGVVTYTWATGDTAIVGAYQVEFEITWPSSKKETVPNSTYAAMVIVSDLDGS